VNIIIIIIIVIIWPLGLLRYYYVVHAFTGYGIVEAPWKVTLCHVTMKVQRARNL